jgi:hypothetical protein
VAVSPAKGHEVLDELEREDPLQAQVVKLRFFAGPGQ